MKRLLLGTVTCVALAAAGGCAYAADMPVKAPVVAPVYSWTGFYIGANVGGGWGSRRRVPARSVVCRLDTIGKSIPVG
jgi:outer membrane immunogenic protein